MVLMKFKAAQVVLAFVCRNFASAAPTCRRLRMLKSMRYWQGYYYCVYGENKAVSFSRPQAMPSETELPQSRTLLNGLEV